MKKVLILLISTVFCLSTFAQFGYYYGEKFIELKANKTGTTLVIANNSKTKKYFDLKISKSESSEKIPVLQKLSNNRYLLNDAEELGEKDYKSKMFKDKSGTIVFILPRIILSLKKESSIKPLLEHYKNILTVEPNPFRRICYPPEINISICNAFTI